MTSSSDSIRNLQIITALDSLSYGLTYGFIARYIRVLGGSTLTVGILAVTNLIGDLLSGEVSKMLTHVHGKRYALFFILNTALVTNLMMVLTCSYWLTILVRFLFSLTNQSQNLCLDMLLGHAQDARSEEQLRKRYSFLSGSGYILGPIMSGYIFPWGFGYTGALAALLALVNVTLLMKVQKNASDSNPEHADRSVLETACRKITENARDFRNCNYEKHWDLLVVKYLFAGGVIIFFSKFAPVLRRNHAADSWTIGWVGAYINALVFASTYYVTTNRTKNPNENYFLLLGAVMMLNCCAPLFELYLIFLTLATVLRSVLMISWRGRFEERRNESLMRLNGSASIVAGLTFPLFFGATANLMEYHAVMVFSSVPMLICWAILRWYSKHIEIEQATDDDDDDKKES